MPETPTRKFSFDNEFFESSVSGRMAGLSPSARLPNPKQKAYDDGFAAGLQQGLQQAQAEVTNLQTLLRNTLASMEQTLQQRDEQLTLQLLALLHNTLHHLVGQLVTQFPDTLLEEHLRTLLPLIKQDETLTLRIHPSARHYHEKLKLSHASILGLPMHIVPDTTLGPTDAVIEWKNGGVESKLSKHLEAVGKILAAGGVPATSLPPLPEPAVLPEPPSGLPPATSGPPPFPQPSTPTTSSPSTLNPLEAAAQTAKSRAAELLGDDDLVDALKS